MGIADTRSVVIIGGFEYETTLFKVSTGRPLRTELLKLVGEAGMRALMGIATSPSGGIGEASIEVLASAGARVFQNLDGAFLARLQDTCCAHTRFREVGGSENNWADLAAAHELHFMGKYEQLDQLTWHHLRANYFPFFDASPAWKLLVLVGEKALSHYQSQLTSPTTGSSGESSPASTSA